MASVNIDYLLNDADKVNWLKGAFVMNITDDAIRPFVEQEIKTFHSDIKSNFKHGSLCGKCKSTNAKYCHSRRCSDITSKIESAHRFKGPCYKNSDIAKWLSDPWEIAKCYMSRSKDLEGKPDSEIDCPSLLNIVINNTRYETLIPQVDMTNENNVFCQARNARNKTMHSKSHQMTETDLKDYCDIFIEIVKLIGDSNSEQNVKKIEKVRDTALSLTAVEIVKLNEQAARYREFTEDEIEKMKTKLWEEAEQIIKHIKDVAEKAIGTSLIAANFIEGCKESLYRLTIEHFQRLRPDNTKEDEWTVAKFVQSLINLPDINNLSSWHNDTLFQKTHSVKDIKEWDLFLLCCILQYEMRVPVPSNVRLYVKSVRQFRDELIHNKAVQKDLSKLCDNLDEPLKLDTLQIFNKTFRDPILSNNALETWQREEKNFSNESMYRKADVEKDKRMMLMEQRISALERKGQESSVGNKTKSQDLNRGEELQAERDNGGIAATSCEVNVNIVPLNVSQTEKKVLQDSMTSTEKNDEICQEIDFYSDFKSQTGCIPNGFVHGSIVLKVECPSVAKIVEFWKGCTDGTVVKAMSTLRNAYRRYLGNNKLEFDIVLKMKEVIRCRNIIFDDLNLRLERLTEQLTDEDGPISQTTVLGLSYEGISPKPNVTVVSPIAETKVPLKQLAKHELKNSNPSNEFKEAEVLTGARLNKAIYVKSRDSSEDLEFGLGPLRLLTSEATKQEPAVLPSARLNKAIEVKSRDSSEDLELGLGPSGFLTPEATKQETAVLPSAKLKKAIKVKSRDSSENLEFGVGHPWFLTSEASEHKMQEIDVGVGVGVGNKTKGPDLKLKRKRSKTETLALDDCRPYRPKRVIRGEAEKDQIYGDKGLEGLEKDLELKEDKKASALDDLEPQFLEYYPIYRELKDQIYGDKG